jgi:hypothetical protein
MTEQQKIKLTQEFFAGLTLTEQERLYTFFHTKQQVENQGTGFGRVSLGSGGLKLPDGLKADRLKKTVSTQ